MRPHTTVHGIYTSARGEAQRSMRVLLNDAQKVLPGPSVRNGSVVALGHSFGNEVHDIGFGLWLGIWVFDLEIVSVGVGPAKSNLQGSVKLVESGVRRAGERMGDGRISDFSGI